MNLIVDTKIIFSLILNPKSKLAEVLLNPLMGINLYSCYFMKFELQNHYDKLLKLADIDISEFREIEFFVSKDIKYINEEYIPESDWLKAKKLTENIDDKDTPFVALSINLGFNLLTNDKKLTNGLKKKGFMNLISASELIKLVENV